MMNTRLLFVLIFTLLACNGKEKEVIKELNRYSLNDFYADNTDLDDRVAAVFNSLNKQERIAQMLVVAAGRTGKPLRTVEKLIRDNVVGGVLMLSGEKQELTSLARHFDSLSMIQGNIPLLYSSDAEPSLINRKIIGTQSVPKTVELGTVERCDSVAQIISHELLSMGIMHNYAPVLDLSPNNAAITNRTFGNDSAAVVGMSSTFINTSQSLGVVATAKHFPGHGLVSGDTHNQLVAIDGRMKELDHYKPLIDQGVLSIMVGHIAVINNKEYDTEGLPASCSSVIVTDLLKEQLGFKGIVITDAMNMGALRNIEKASLKAVKAGCDMILMEPNEYDLLEDIISAYDKEESFKAQVDKSVMKILRLKICLNML